MHIAQLELMFGLVKLEFRWLEGVGGAIFSLHILSSLVNFRLHTRNWFCNLPGSALKVSDHLWLSFSLALAKPNKTNCCGKLIMIQIVSVKAK